jgi:Flp pilus assembly protein CpaB
VSTPPLLTFARKKLGAPRRASRYFWLVVVLLSAGSTLYLWKGADTVEVYTASVDLPAFHQLGDGDLRPVRIRAAGRQPDVMSTNTKITGRYTLTKVDSGAPLLGNRLGPALPRGELAGYQIASLPIAASDLANGAISRGDRVDIILSSTATDGTLRSGVLQRVLVLDVQAAGTDPANTVLVATLSPADASTLMNAGGTARIFALRIAPYVAP